MKGNRVEIRFTSKAYCDVTVAIKDQQGRIVRHLVSGVLGDNAAPAVAEEIAATDDPLGWQGRSRPLL